MTKQDLPVGEHDQIQVTIKDRVAVVGRALDSALQGDQLNVIQIFPDGEGRVVKVTAAGDDIDASDLVQFCRGDSATPIDRPRFDEILRADSIQGMRHRPCPGTRRERVTCPEDDCIRIDGHMDRGVKHTDGTGREWGLGKVRSSVSRIPDRFHGTDDDFEPAPPADALPILPDAPRLYGLGDHGIDDGDFSHEDVFDLRAHTVELRRLLVEARERLAQSFRGEDYWKERLREHQAVLTESRADLESVRQELEVAISERDGAFAQDTESRAECDRLKEEREDAKTAGGYLDLKTRAEEAETECERLKEEVERFKGSAQAHGHNAAQAQDERDSAEAKLTDERKRGIEMEGVLSEICTLLKVEVPSDNLHGVFEAVREEIAKSEAERKRLDGLAAQYIERARDAESGTKAAIAAKEEAEKWKQEMADQGQELAEKLGEAENRVRELEGLVRRAREVQDATRTEDQTGDFTDPYEEALEAIFDAVPEPTPDEGGEAAEMRKAIEGLKRAPPSKPECRHGVEKGGQWVSAIDPTTGRCLACSACPGEQEAEPTGSKHWPFGQPKIKPDPPAASPEKKTPVCECELRNRAWDPNTGRCRTCGLNTYLDHSNEEPPCDT